jgi:hypothetical protein
MTDWQRRAVAAAVENNVAGFQEAARNLGLLRPLREARTAAAAGWAPEPEALLAALELVPWMRVTPAPGSGCALLVVAHRARFMNQGDPPWDAAYIARLGPAPAVWAAAAICRDRPLWSSVAVKCATYQAAAQRRTGRRFGPACARAAAAFSRAGMPRALVWAGPVPAEPCSAGPTAPLAPRLGELWRCGHDHGGPNVTPGSAAGPWQPALDARPPFNFTSDVVWAARLTPDEPLGAPPAAARRRLAALRHAIPRCLEETILEDLAGRDSTWFRGALRAAPAGHQAALIGAAATQIGALRAAPIGAAAAPAGHQAGWLDDPELWRNSTPANALALARQPGVAVPDTVVLDGAAFPGILLLPPGQLAGPPPLARASRVIGGLPDALLVPDAACRWACRLAERTARLGWPAGQAAAIRQFLNAAIVIIETEVAWGAAPEEGSAASLRAALDMLDAEE